MIVIPFDVNDRRLRDALLQRLLNEAIESLAEDTKPLWGTMIAQHMVEHLVWAFELSTGIADVACHTPPHLLDRAKRFLYDNRPTPREFKNPLLGKDPPAFRYPTVAEAKTVLRNEITRFHSHYRERPDAIHVHPLFGLLGVEEWERSHFKHCYHHLLQFQLVSRVGPSAL